MFKFLTPAVSCLKKAADAEHCAGLEERTDLSDGPFVELHTRDLIQTNPALCICLQSNHVLLSCLNVAETFVVAPPSISSKIAHQSKTHNKCMKDLLLVLLGVNINGLWMKIKGPGGVRSLDKCLDT